ncbi:GNAT family N-acetyltransferase [Paracoccus sp. p3-h83]|uniref:GNAT family N-acetyltransferase n=1 Tax=Paracoccus sp. p3-h83 TaxID=3342805 RepID=UPI0035B6B70C
MGRTNLQTERLSLRPVAPEDEAAVLAALADIQVVRWLAVVPFPYRPEHFRDWQPTARPGETWAVDTPGGLIGVVGLSLIEDEAEGKAVDAAAIPAMADSIAEGDAPGESAVVQPSAEGGRVERLPADSPAGASLVGDSLAATPVPATPVSADSLPGDAALTGPARASDPQVNHTAPPPLAVALGLLPAEAPTFKDADAPVAQAADAPASDASDDAPDPLQAPRPPMRLELGYWFARSAWGRGYGTEAVGAVVADHFADPQAAPITAHVHDGNIRSESVLRRIGFQAIGPRRYYAEALKREVDATTLRITRSDWLAANPLRIGTERLVLDPLSAADAPALRRLLTYPAVGRNLFLFPADWSEAAARQFIADWAWQGQPPYRLAIRLRDAQGGLALIGMIGIGAGEAPEVFYAIDPVHGRSGLMTEALAAFLDHVIRRHAPPALTARVFTDNGTSARLLERAGFQRQPDTGMAHSAARGEAAPVWTYRLDLGANPAGA